jgi:hypothetical protein
MKILEDFGLTLTSANDGYKYFGKIGAIVFGLIAIGLIILKNYVDKKREKQRWENAAKMDQQKKNTQSTQQMHYPKETMESLHKKIQADLNAYRRYNNQHKKSNPK